MISIGIIANPASGKDIRRIVSHATVIDNYEKVNIVERIILGAQGCGVDEVYIMADTFQIGNRVIDNLIASKELKANIKLIDIKLNGNVSDTITFIISSTFQIALDPTYKSLHITASIKAMSVNIPFLNTSILLSLKYV
jgi:predicted polyphosphate/ATP-dependent NAD kinase